MNMDGPIDPPEYVFGICAKCLGSEEDHEDVVIVEGYHSPVTYTVCPAVVDVAEAIEADYPFELVYRLDACGDECIICERLKASYEDAMTDVADNTYEEDDGD